jgi:MoaA/NifB/PqqE/SkfB family radical SAM enzyme
MVYAVKVVSSGVRHGLRYLVQKADYHSGRGIAPPDRVGLTLTHRCNCRCLMCDLWKMDDRGGELPAGRWIELIEELHAWIGPFRLALNGGETFLKPGVYDIIRRAAALGLTINPVSGGLVFQSDRHFDSLMSSGLRAITFGTAGVPGSTPRWPGSSGGSSARSPACRCR